MCHFDELVEMRRRGENYLVLEQGGQSSGSNIIPFLRVIEPRGLEGCANTGPKTYIGRTSVTWDCAFSNSSGTRVSLSVLERLFPRDEFHSGLTILKDSSLCRIYGQFLVEDNELVVGSAVGYECKSCDSIFLGHPFMEGDFDYALSLFENTELDAYCHRCLTHLY